MAQSVQTHLGQLGPVANVVIRDQNGQAQILHVIQATNTKQTGAGTMQLTLPGGKQVAATLATKASTGGASQSSGTGGLTRAVLKSTTPVKSEPGSSQGNVLKTTSGQVLSIKYPNASTVPKGQVIAIPVNTQSTADKNSQIKLATSNGGQLQLVTSINSQASSPASVKTTSSVPKVVPTNHDKVPAILSVANSSGSPSPVSSVAQLRSPDSSATPTKVPAPSVAKIPLLARPMKTPVKNTIKIPDGIQCYVLKNAPKPSPSPSSTNSIPTFKPVNVASPSTPTRSLPGYMKTYSPLTPSTPVGSLKPKRIAAAPPPKTPFISSILDRSGSRKRHDFEINYSNFDGKRRRSEKGSKGLRHFSSKVCEKVERKGVTTYNEVADELVTEFSDPTRLTSIMEQQYDQKNIRRRVYDALNVLMAMGIIAKERKEIRWLGLPVNSLHEAKELEQQRLALAERVKEKKANLNYLLSQQVALKNLLERNRQKEKEEGPPLPNSTVKLPFIIVNTSKHTVIDCEIENDRSEYQFKFDNAFEIQDDIQVLFRMGLAMGLENGSCKQEDIGKILNMIPETFHPYITSMCNSESETRAATLPVTTPLVPFQSPRPINQVMVATESSKVVKPAFLDSSTKRIIPPFAFHSDAEESEPEEPTDNVQNS